MKLPVITLVIQDWIALLQLRLQLNMFQLRVGFELSTQAVATSNPTTELRHLSFDALCKSYLF
jgi:hypothetical protein